MVQVLTAVVPGEDGEAEEEEDVEMVEAEDPEAAEDGDDKDPAAPPKANGNAALKPNGKAKAPGGLDRQRLLFCERFVEFMIDLMSQAPTRRYAHALLEDRAVLIKCRMSALFQHEQGVLHSLSIAKLLPPNNLF